MNPGAPPLTVGLNGPELSLSWEDVGADAYRISRGRVDTLFVTGAYDHALIAEVALPSMTWTAAKGRFYYLLSATCAGVESPLGPDSDGVERPPGRMVEVVIRLTGNGPPLAGVGFLMTHPPGTITMDAMVEPVGPLAPSTGALSVVNTTVDGEVRGTGVTDQPFRSPVMVWAVRFGWLEARPDPSEFALTECAATDELGFDVPGITCEIASVFIQG